MNKTERDALVAQCREMSDKLEGDGTALTDLFRQAAEALAAPAGGGQGEAVKWERRVVNKKTGSIHYDWCACSQAEFDVGSTEGSTLRVEYRALYTTPPAASVDVEAVLAIVDGWMEGYDHFGTGDSRSAAMSEKEWQRDREQLRALIDSAGGAKVYQCPRCSTSMEVDPTAKPAPQPAEGTKVCPTCSGWGLVNEDAPQPAEGDGAVYGYVYQLADEEPSFEFAADRWPSRGGNHTETAVYTRPSAAAAVADDEANQSPEQLAQWLDAKYARHHEDEDRQAAAMLRKLAAAPAASAVAVDGAWSVTTDGRHIFCDDFTCDPQLKLTGDFPSNAARVDYAERIAAALNNAALAQQEPRHDALADGEAASA